MSIKQVINNLPEGIKDSIFGAFDEERAYHCEYEPGRFIGVHLTNFENLILEEQRGVWSIGYYRNRSQEKNGEGYSS